MYNLKLERRDPPTPLIGGENRRIAFPPFLRGARGVERSPPLIPPHQLVGEEGDQRTQHNKAHHNLGEEPLIVDVVHLNMKYTIYSTLLGNFKFRSYTILLTFFRIVILECSPPSALRFPVDHYVIPCTLLVFYSMLPLL